MQLSDGTNVLCTSLRDGSYEIEIEGRDEDEGDGNSNGAIFHVNGTISSEWMVSGVTIWKNSCAAKSRSCCSICSIEYSGI